MPLRFMAWGDCGVHCQLPWLHWGIQGTRFMAFYGHDFKGSFWTQLSTQIIGIIIIVIWSVIGGLFIFTLVWSLGLFATDPENSKFNKVKNCILGKLRRPQDPYTNLSP